MDFLGEKAGLRNQNNNNEGMLRKLYQKYLKIITKMRYYFNFEVGMRMDKTEQIIKKQGPSI